MKNVSNAQNPAGLAWPSAWIVFGPMDKSDPVVDAEILKTIPKELRVAGRAFQGLRVECADGRIDFAKLFGGHKEGMTAYAFAEVVAREDMELSMGAGADWWMQWWIDGKPIYDTLENGNQGKPFSTISILDHKFKISLSKGRHVLSIRVISGSGGFLVVSGGPDQMLVAPRAKLPGEEPFPGMPIPHDPNESLFGARIQRTMTLLATSTPNHRNSVKIIFYGQSIVAQRYVDSIVISNLEQRYTNAVIIAENRAIGGYTAPALVRPAVHDVYPFYPDLVVFHVYGGHDTGELERIVSNVRRYTTAEILMWTHHYGDDIQSQTEGSAFRRYLAQKYDCELVEVREAWGDYLERYKLERKDLLIDGIHLNNKGGILMGQLVLRHFRYNTLFPCGWANTVRTYEVRRALEEKDDEIVFPGSPWKRANEGAIGTDPSAPLCLRFHGNRVDIVSMKINSPPGSARILIDGRPPSAFPGAYAATRPSKNPISGRPALNRVMLGTNAVAEDWTLSATDISTNGREFAFSLKGTVTGPDGTGKHDKPFVSNSGRIRIDPSEITFRSGCKKPFPNSLDITWKTYLMGMDIWRSKPPLEAGFIDSDTVVQGIPNTEHVLEIVPNGDGPVPLKEIIIHRPPLE